MLLNKHRQLIKRVQTGGITLVINTLVDLIIVKVKNLLEIKKLRL